MQAIPLIIWSWIDMLSCKSPCKINFEFTDRTWDFDKNWQFLETIRVPRAFPQISLTSIWLAPIDRELFNSNFSYKFGNLTNFIWAELCEQMCNFLKTFCCFEIRCHHRAPIEPRHVVHYRRTISKRNYVLATLLFCVTAPPMKTWRRAKKGDKRYPQFL